MDLPIVSLRKMSYRSNGFSRGGSPLSNGSFRKSFRTERIKCRHPIAGKNSRGPMEGKTFRLGEYRITDFGASLIHWEAHHDWGGSDGRCHRLREVLVLGEFEQEKSGYLKGEFLDLLKSLPPWTRTRYFCLASHLHVVGTGRRPDKDLLARLETKGFTKNRCLNRLGIKKGAFRLGRYRITFAPNNEFSWETLGDGNKIVTGNCTLESGILLMGPRRGSKRNKIKGNMFNNCVDCRCGTGPVFGASMTSYTPVKSRPNQKSIISFSVFPQHQNVGLL